MLRKIAVAAPGYPPTLKEGLASIERLSRDAAIAGAEIVCFPESFLPGYPAPGFEREACTKAGLEAAREALPRIARQHSIALIVPMDWYEGDQLFNVAQVISPRGEFLGYQTKNQLDPSEDGIWQPGMRRRLFEMDGLRFGIAICHEGFRYPESVRWAAREGAHVVFHPNFTGGQAGIQKPGEWGSRESPYYEKAQMMRALENTIYFAASNYSFPFPESASAIIDPQGRCIAYQAYGEIGLAVAEIDPDRATGLLARRFRPGCYEHPLSPADEVWKAGT